MENKDLLNLEIKYGFTGSQAIEIINIAKNAGVDDFSSDAFTRIVDFIYNENIIDQPSEVIRELLLKNKIIEGGNV